MHIEVEHLDSTILSLRVDKEFTVDNLKHIVSQNIHIPASDLTLACNGSLLEGGHRFSEYFAGDRCKVLLFLRKGEQIRSNIEVDFGDGRVLFIPACMNWTVGELKQKLQNATKGEHLDETKVFTFTRFIMEDNRRLEEYKLKEGSKILVFSYLNTDPANTRNGEAAPIKTEEEASQPVVSYRVFENPVDDVIKSSLSCTTPLPPSPSPPPLLEQSKTKSAEDQNEYLILSTNSPVPPQTTELSSSWNAAANLTECHPHNSSSNLKNGSESLKSWQASVEPKTIVIPGRFRQRQTKPVFNRHFQSGTGIPDRGKNVDKMDVIFTDGTRKMSVELPTTATVLEGLEAVKTRISDSDKDKLRLFKGYVQMEAHHPLSQYGVLNGSTVVFKKPGPVQKF